MKVRKGNTVFLRADWYLVLRDMELRFDLTAAERDELVADGSLRLVH